MPDRRIEDLVEEYHEGFLTLGGLFSSIVDLLVAGDIDAQLTSLPPETREWIVWSLRDHYSPIAGQAPQDFFILESVCLVPGTEEEYAVDRARREERLRTTEIPGIQDWLRAHPLPPRPPFPVDVVRALRSRTEDTLNALLASRPSNLTPKERRAWSGREAVGRLGAVVAELDSALARAELAGTGSQEQALAWEGFERIAGLLERRDDLSPAETTLVQAAAASRRSNLASAGASPPGTRGVFSGPPAD